jgi:serine phosphatase RsbU (regulator of sigma subunit)
MYIAAILQIVIFSFGIARKMRLDELEKKRIQEEIIEQLRVNERLKDQVNLELENKVQERTREISEQKREITDSISYAQRIQDAVLPRKEYLDQVMPDYFILYKPKDIVSGDFYWIREVKDSLVVVAADCTGHGVPGAFMSMLGITLLNEQLAQNRLDDPGKILDNMRAKVKDMLVQRGKTEEQKDGMEMAVAILHKEKRLLHFAGANHRLLLVRRNSQLTGEEPESEGFVAGVDAHLYDIKGDTQPIGFYWEETTFTNHHIQLKEQDSLYVFTDGFIDQFGGEQRKKFKIHRFKELLLTFQEKSMNQQKLLLEDAFTSWRGDIEQIDDVCIIGIRI